MNEVPRVLVVAGGDWQVPLVKKIKRMGMFALSSNLHPNSPAFRYADVTFVADVRDRAANLAFARAQRVDAVITDQSDIAVPTVAYICEELGLPGIGMKSAELFTNKRLMREFCRAHGFPAPRFSATRSLKEAEDAASEIGYPCVVKPTNNQSSRGITKVNSRDELRLAYESALAHSSEKLILVEEFIGGTELTVEGFKHPSGHRSLAVSRKTHYEHNPMVANRLLYSDSDAEIDYDALRSQHDRLTDAMELPFGITHAEYKYYRGQFYLIETAARGGGTRISSDIVPLMSGVDVSEMLIRLALGHSVEPPRPRTSASCAALDFWEFAPGRVAEIDGIDEVSAHPGVIAAGLSVSAGQEIFPPADDRQRHGFVIAHAPDKHSIESLLEELRRMVRVRYA